MRGAVVTKWSMGVGWLDGGICMGIFEKRAGRGGIISALRPGLVYIPPWALYVSKHN